jgi:hypothetical protein
VHSEENIDPRAVGFMWGSYRNFGTQALTVVLSAAYAAFTVTIAYVLGTRVAVWSALAIVAMLLLFTLVTVVSRVEVKPEGIRIVNGFKRHDVAWSQVERFRSVRARSSRATFLLLAVHFLLFLPASMAGYFVHRYWPRLYVVAIQERAGNAFCPCLGLVELRYSKPLDHERTQTDRTVVELHAALAEARRSASTSPLS